MQNPRDGVKYFQRRTVALPEVDLMTLSPVFEDDPNDKSSAYCSRVKAIFWGIYSASLNESELTAEFAKTDESRKLYAIWSKGENNNLVDFKPNRDLHWEGFDFICEYYNADHIPSSSRSTFKFSRFRVVDFKTMDWFKLKVADKKCTRPLEIYQRQAYKLCQACLLFGAFPSRSKKRS